MTAPGRSHARHLHREDYPGTIAVIEAVVRGRPVPGVAPTDAGLWVDWDELDRSWLSSTERAAVAIARGLAVAECCGGLPHEFAPAVTASVIDVVCGRRLQMGS